MDYCGDGARIWHLFGGISENQVWQAVTVRIAERDTRGEFCPAVENRRDENAEREVVLARVRQGGIGKRISPPGDVDGLGRGVETASTFESPGAVARKQRTVAIEGVERQIDTGVACDVFKQDLGIAARAAVYGAWYEPALAIIEQDEAFESVAAGDREICIAICVHVRRSDPGGA